ncbi:pseudouridine synthase [Aquicoccus sp.]|uniref:pseudouridine synthase n=1 Tax=Aquicoccus sp. TaxID=2055851 RepID=UPI0035643DB0
MNQKPPKKAAPSAPQGDRIAKVIARAGLASRREAERMIETGRVAVNGTVITRAALNVTDRDSVTVDGKPLDAPAPTRLWLYHKPAGLVTTTRDEQGRPTIFDDLPADLPRVLSVGRLDLNSEGLLLLTNDGTIKRRLELPSTGWLRRYRVRVNGRPTEATFDPLREGLTIDGESFQPMVVTLDRQQGANAWITVALREGKNREVRRAMEAVGLAVNRLIRISYGPFQLGQLKPGEVQEVRGRVLRDQLGLEPVETPPDPKAAKTRTGTGPRPKTGTRPGAKPGAKPAGPRGAKPIPQRRRKPSRRS